MSCRSKLSNTVRKEYQALEGRRLLAGDVTVFENFHLYIRGDANDNQLEVVAVDNQLQIRGINGTTINGRDAYTLKGTTMTEQGVSFAGGLRAHLGPGHDDFSVRDAQFESLSIVYGGTGNDEVAVADSSFLDELTLQTYEGDDSISALDSHFGGTFRALTLDGEDLVSLQNSMMAGNSLVVTGEHADVIHSQNSHFMGEINLFLPLNGDDMVTIDSPVVGENQLGIFLGNGDDTIHGDFSGAAVESRIRIGGQGGTDRSEMTMDEGMESQVVMATVEATGEVTYRNSDEGPVVYGADAFAKLAENGYQTIPATQVQFNESTDIYSIAWSGSYEYSTPNENDRYVIRVYNNEIAENQWVGEYDIPGNEIVFESVLEMEDLTRVATGVTWSDSSPEREIFEFEADIELSFAADQKYWISIHQDLQVGQSQTAFAEYDNTFYQLVRRSDTPRISATYDAFNDIWPTSGLNENALVFELRS